MNSYNYTGIMLSRVKYLLDMQPGLVKVLAQDEEGSVTRFVHDPMDMAAQQDPSG